LVRLASTLIAWATADSSCRLHGDRRVRSNHLSGWHSASCSRGLPRAGLMPEGPATRRDGARRASLPGNWIVRVLTVRSSTVPTSRVGFDSSSLLLSDDSVRVWRRRAP